eukprot:Clim_evm7s145 gene=Clim_evmTU7s145
MAEPIYSAEQINIPPELPGLLKAYMKAVIKAQPEDLVGFSADYFTGLNDREQSNPAAKVTSITVEPTTVNTESLRVELEKVAAGSASIAIEDIRSAAEKSGMTPDDVNEIISLGNLGDSAEWLHFLALCCTMKGSGLRSSLDELITAFPNSELGLEQFESAYRFLAKMDGDVPEDKIDVALQALKGTGKSIVAFADLDVIELQ